MAHNNIRNDDKSLSEKKLFLTMMLNFLITFFQIIGGIFSGSLSLISDAIHNLSDGIAIIITYFAYKISKKPNNFKYTFGYKRAEILAAILNSSTLLFICFFLIKEAIERLKNPISIEGNLMLIVAVIGLLANIIGTFLLKSDSNKNINIRSAYFHLLSDTFASLAIIVGALFIIYYKIYWIDPILTILIALYILKETYEIIKEAVDILMMSNTSEIDLNEVKKLIEKIDGVINIHHVHIWKLNDNETHFEAHVEVEDMKVSQTYSIQSVVEKLLHDKYEINHTTLQFECGVCEEDNLLGHTN